MKRKTIINLLRNKMRYYYYRQGKFPYDKKRGKIFLSVSHVVATYCKMTVFAGFISITGNFCRTPVLFYPRLSQSAFSLFFHELRSYRNFTLNLQPEKTNLSRIIMPEKAIVKPRQMKANIANKKNIVAKPSHIKWWLIALSGLLILTYIIYTPALKNTITGWDDKDYIVTNKLVHGLSADTVVKIFSLKTGIIMGNYHPVTTLSYAIEYHYAKLNPAVYHTTNIIIHLLNILLIFLFIVLLTRNNYTAAFITALFFAIHPMHVESVAWVAERKDLLYTFFEIAALCAYTAFLRGSRKKWFYYLLSLILFLLSILSKGMAVAMAALLPLIDYYCGRKLSAVKIWIEKLPFLALSLIFGIIATQAQHASKSLSFTDYSFYDRILFASYGVITYLWKSIIPAGLSCYYDYPAKGTYGWYMVFVLLSLGIAWLVYLSARHTKVIVFGALFFLFTLTLVLQILPVGGAVIAERYTYIPYIGLFFMIGMGVSYILENKAKSMQLWKPAVIILLSLMAIVFSVGTYNRCFVWKDTLSIWNDALAKYPDCIKGLNGRGDAYNEKQLYQQAITDLDKALQLKTDYTDAYYNRGISYYYLGKQALDAGQKEQAVKLLEQSIYDNTQAIKYSPDLSLAWFNRSGNYYTLGKFEQALADALKAKELGMFVDPEYIKALKGALNAEKKQ